MSLYVFCKLIITLGLEAINLAQRHHTLVHIKHEDKFRQNLTEDDPLHQNKVQIAQLMVRGNFGPSEGATASPRPPTLRHCNTPSV